MTEQQGETVYSARATAYGDGRDRQTVGRPFASVFCMQDWCSPPPTELVCAIDGLFR